MAQPVAMAQQVAMEVAMVVTVPSEVINLVEEAEMVVQAAEVLQLELVDQTITTIKITELQALPELVAMAAVAVVLAPVEMSVVEMQAQAEQVELLLV